MRVVFRADGNEQIGLGHFTRCLAIADMIKDQFDCSFALSVPSNHQILSLENAGVGLIKLPAGNEHYAAFLEALTGNEIVVLDNYFFDTNYQQAIKDKGSRLVCINDIPERHYKADVVINHGGDIYKDDYSVEAYTLLFLGPQYSLLRKEFFELHQQKNNHGNNLFISLGGADPQNVTLDVLKGISQYANYSNVFCVIGGANVHRDALNAFINTSSLNIKLLENLSAADMVDYMSRSAVAITAASTIAYEYLTIGGQLYIIKTADNQAKFYSYLINNRLAAAYNGNVDNMLSAPDTKAVFDGSSPQRVSRIFKSLEYATKFRLRRAVADDLLMIYDWINDDEVRAQSFSKDKINIEDHSNWYHKAINRPSTYYYILEEVLTNQALGQIRFEREGEETLLNYLISANARGKGLGGILVIKGIEQALMDTQEKLNFTAFVKTNNIASNNIFKNLVFTREPAPEYADSNKYYYSFRKNERI
jgi:UDP-2,4-diacetamido-2,4,6-trideoxy-beta-L-altropyranose hydrolase